MPTGKLVAGGGGLRGRQACGQPRRDDGRRRSRRNDRWPSRCPKTCRHVQGRLAKRVRGVDVGAVPNEQLDHFRLPRAASGRMVQGRVPAAVSLSNVDTSFQQDGRVAHETHHVKRRLAPFGPGCRVGTRNDERLEHCLVPVVRLWDTIARRAVLKETRLNLDPRPSVIARQSLHHRGLRVRQTKPRQQSTGPQRAGAVAVLAVCYASMRWPRLARCTVRGPNEEVAVHRLWMDLRRGRGV